MAYQPPQFYYIAPYPQIFVTPMPIELTTPSSEQLESKEEEYRRGRHTWDKHEDSELMFLIKELDLTPDKPIPFALLA